MLRIPHCLDNRLTDGGKVVSPTHQPQFTPQKHYYLCFRYSFLLEAFKKELLYIFIYIFIYLFKFRTKTERSNGNDAVALGSLAHAAARYLSVSFLFMYDRNICSECIRPEGSKFESR
jgi:hypothetical protein